MYVIKRDGRREAVHFDKITRRISHLCFGLNADYCSPIGIAQKVVAGVYPGVTTSQLDELAAETAAYSATQHPDFAILAARIAVSNLHKNTLDSFSKTVERLYNHVHPRTNKRCSLVSEELYELSQLHAERIDGAINYNFDFNYDFFGFKTLERAYLLKIDNKIIERPQHMIMRVALGIHGDDLDGAIETYNLMSQKYFTHATPTLFNSGTQRPQLSSCFLIATKSDSIEGIYDTLKSCACISKWAGGIGVSIHDIRAKDSYVAGTNGYSNGIVPMLRVFNDTARYVDQCFPKDTRVYTEDGLKWIQDIGIGDKVLTSNGTYQSVRHPVRHQYDGPMLRINGIRVTPEHQIQVRERNGSYDFEKFIDAKDIISEMTREKPLEHFLMFPVPTLVEDQEYLTLEDCRFYGMMLNRGEFKTDGTCKLELYMDGHWDETPSALVFVQEYLSGVGVQDIVISDINWVSWTISPRFKFTKSNIFDEVNYNRRWDPKFRHLPLEKAVAILKGIAESFMFDVDDKIRMHLNCEESDVTFQYMRLGMSPYKFKFEGNELSWVGRKLFAGKSECGEPVVSSDVHVKVKEITETSYKGTVYDFEVDYPHTYVVAGLGIAHNGGGRRKGSFAIYLEPFHADIEDFLELRKNHGKEEARARDLFYALWIPDLFMERVQSDSGWTLFCPNEAPGLSDVYGDEFEALYERYEREGRGRKTMRAQELWYKILGSQIETGTPYMLYKDHVNRKSNQKNLGTIKSSNLCVTGDTMILTSKGYYPIFELYWSDIKDNVKVWNGFEWSKVKIIKTGEKVPVITIGFSNGIYLRCTPHHKFIIDPPGTEGRVDAKDLKIGMTISKCDYPIIDGPEFSDNPIRVPINYSMINKMGWLRFYTEYVYDKPHPYGYATDIFLFLQSLGVASKIRKVSEKKYKVDWLEPPITTIMEQYETGTLPEKRSFDARITVTSISDEFEVEDTFCFNEPKRHMGVFNGILTGNCTEIVEYTAPDEIAVCFTEDTMILTGDGVKKIVDCDNQMVYSHFNNDIDLEESKHFEKAELVCNGEKEVYKLEVFGHAPIKATENHLFLTLEKRDYYTKTNTYKWKALKDLNVGDKIITPNIEPLPAFSNIIETDTEYLTAGWMLGDGWFTGRGWGVCFGPDDAYASKIVINQLKIWHKECIDIEIKGKNSVKEYVQKNGVINWQSSRKSFKKLLNDKFGYHEALAGEKYIPEKIKKSTPNQQANFLSALFSADGCVFMVNSSYAVALSSASKKLLVDTQYMLKSFGINSRIRYGEVKTRKGKFQGNLSICNNKDKLKFGEYIGFSLSDKKQQKLSEFMKTTTTREIYNEHSEVKSITKVGIEKVYDLCLEKSHNFIANNMVVHNCNLASINLRKFVTPDGYDFEGLIKITQVVTRNLNRVIDRNFYPVEEARRSNMRHRPIGIGVQGLADVFMELRMPFESAEARKLNRDIFETIYYGAMLASMNLAREQGPYETFPGSPTSEGIFQFDMWGKLPNAELGWDWDTLKDQVKEHGIRNSLLVAPMPTASTSQILGNNECFEPYTSNIYTRRVLAGEFTIINRHLFCDLLELGLWSPEMKNQIIGDRGSVQNIKEIPPELKELYKTVWEIKQRAIIDMAADRGAFVDQSQSMNIHMEDANIGKLTSMHFYTWKKGLKTGMYYLRTKPKANAIQFTVDQKALDDCLSCGS